MRHNQNLFRRTPSGMYDFIVHRCKTPYFHFFKRLVHLNGLKAISSSWDSYSVSWVQGAKTHPSGVPISDPHTHCGTLGVPFSDPHTHCGPLGESCSHCSESLEFKKPDIFQKPTSKSHFQGSQLEAYLN